MGKLYTSSNIAVLLLLLLFSDIYGRDGVGPVEEKGRGGRNGDSRRRMRRRKI